MSFQDSNPISCAIQEEVVSCTPEYSLSDACQLMSKYSCSSVIVVKNTIPIGILTESDVLKIDLTQADQLAQPVSQLMSSPIHTIKLEASLDDATHLFKCHGIRHLVVTDEQGTLCGILSQSDVVRHQNAEYFLQMNEVSSIINDSKLFVLEQSVPLPEIIQQMQNEHLDHVVITRGDQPLGLITERDITKMIAKGVTHPSLDEVLSKPLMCIPDTMTLLSARSLMSQRRLRHMGVKNKHDEFIGVISFNQILNSIEQTYVKRLRHALADRVADLNRTEKDLHLAKALISASSEGIMVTDDQGTIQSVNPAFSILTGYSEREALGQNASLLKSGRQSLKFYQQLWKELQDQGAWKGEIWNRRKNGEVYPQWLSVTAIRDEVTGKTFYAGIFSDITERKKSESLIHNLAYYDPLTKLPNRQLLFDRLEVAMASAHRDAYKLAVVFIDLDHFKRINDTLGHTIGDELLCEVAQRLKKNIREGDTIARIGGDEIILLLTELDNLDTAYSMIQRVHESLKEPFNIESYELFITASIGCSIYPEDGEDRDSLLKSADTAMYQAKTLGRNNIQLYSAEMNARSLQRLTLGNQLRIALDKKEFELFYQPKLDLTNAKIVGAEALIRWNSSALGQVSPAEFIPAAEELGLINDIGAWVLEQACQDAKKWLDQGIDIPVSVNISPRQFYNQDLLEQVSTALKATDLPSALLDLEITESCMIEDADKVCQVLKELRATGVTTSMDDFGTGYSSLSLLKRIPLDHLKIDRSFIQGIPEDNDNAELVSTIILMAHNLGLKVVAEGVEDANQCDFLQTHRCDQAQGYLYSPAVAADAFIKLAIEQRFCRACS